MAADYMRHANERRIHLDKALEYRRDLFTSRSRSWRLSSISARRHGARTAGAITAREGDLEADYQAASDHLNLVQTALRQQEKSSATKRISTELQIRLKSRMKWWRKPSIAQERERSPR
ncbi:hypothetical protein LN650_21450 [Klebsiella pneumoniae subsp. pneumoniae]|nr:hypothetical protein [Klebsiella pneumoniae subsp. pneumoniae]